ncbi:MAG: hypothetical protein EXS08_13020 [Planctomycetes bacterium]|nr:hypothetical protein [Planctomycetota bacterium]
MSIVWFLLVSSLAQAALGPAAAPERVRLERPALPPELVTLDLTLGGAPVTLELARHSLRAADAFVRVAGADGSTDQAPPPVTTYRGSVRGEERSVVLASLLPSGWSAWIERDTGEHFELEPLGDASRPELHVVRPAVDPPDFRCGASDDAVRFGPAGGRLEFGTRANERRCLSLAEIAFDADLQYYQAKGSSVPAVVAAIDQILNQVDFFYSRDVQITYALTAYVVRTSAFYVPTGGGNLLDLFRTEWTTNQAAIPRDMAHLMTGQPGSLIEFGGLAYVGVTCNQAVHYGWSMDGANIVGHELGHNWGAGHCHDTSPCNNMCGACFYVAPNTREIILAFRDAVTCLDPVADRPPRVAPYAMPDRVLRRKDALESGVLVDVLKNDDDGDCQPLQVPSFDFASERGGVVQRAPSVAGEWRERLLYHGPPTPFVGADRFAYQVSDGRLASAGEVEIEGTPLEVLGWWPLDELAGTSAGDVARGVHPGTLVAGPTWVAGRLGGALAFDGVNDRVNLPALNADTNQLTLTCWVKRQGAQANFAGLVFSRSGSTVAGLSVTSGGGLRYTWNDDPPSYGWNPGLTLPDNTWVFVALVVEPQRATLYLKNATLVAAVNPLAHAPEAFDGGLQFAQDSAGSRFFKGALDDVRMYAYPLTAAEIARLAAGGGPADAPLPRDGGGWVPESGDLAWIGGIGASTHDVYLGTDYAAVRAATSLAPEFQGTLATTSLTPGALAPDTTYYWRVDARGPNGLEPGAVWQLDAARRHRWTLDESAGTVANDVVANVDGTYLGGVALNGAGATPSLGTSVTLDGTNDRIELPALNLASNHVTITGWLKRNGAQQAWAGVAFSRAGSTVAGLNFGTANELRYHWNGGSYDWDSGLVVPDGQWVFVALVVEPTQATLYLGQGGTLTSATNAIAHGLEEFDGKLVLGRDPGFTTRNLKGGLDDVRVYDHALSPSELEALYSASL